MTDIPALDDLAPGDRTPYVADFEAELRELGDGTRILDEVTWVVEPPDTLEVEGETQTSYRALAYLSESVLADAYVVHVSATAVGDALFKKTKSFRIRGAQT